MNIFHNDSRSGYEEIVSYGPKWLTEYKEMDAVYQYAGWTLDLMANFLEQIIRNQFPAQADEATLRIFEQMLGIEYDPTLSLEERRRAVLAYYSGTGKLSKSEIQALIRMYTGCESDIWWDGPVLQIRVHYNGKSVFSDSKVYQILQRRMPAHIAFMIRNMLCIFELYEIFRWKIHYKINVSLKQSETSLQYWTEKYMFKNIHSEKISMAMCKDMFLDGKIILDGTYMLNGGREEL